jgi:hypothetical protein
VNSGVHRILVVNSEGGYMCDRTFCDEVIRSFNNDTSQILEIISYMAREDSSIFFLVLKNFAASCENFSFVPPMTLSSISYRVP